MQNSKVESYLKKTVSIIGNGIEPLTEGKHNFENYNVNIEALANERKNTCVNCPMFVDEPIEFLKVQDNRIIELSDKMCNDCGCTLSYKLRQSKTICDKWEK